MVASLQGSSSRTNEETRRRLRPTLPSQPSPARPAPPAPSAFQQLQMSTFTVKRHTGFLLRCLRAMPSSAQAYDGNRYAPLLPRPLSALTRSLAAEGALEADPGAPCLLVRTQDDDRLLLPRVARPARHARGRHDRAGAPGLGRLGLGPAAPCVALLCPSRTAPPLADSPSCPRPFFQPRVASAALRLQGPSLSSRRRRPLARRPRARRSPSARRTSRRLTRRCSSCPSSGHRSTSSTGLGRSSSLRAASRRRARACRSPSCMSGSRSNAALTCRPALGAARNPPPSQLLPLERRDERREGRPDGPVRLRHLGAARRLVRRRRRARVGVRRGFAGPFPPSGRRVRRGLLLTFFLGP